MCLQEYLYDKIANTILTWKKEIVKDIYVISLFVYYEDDPRNICVVLGYNTNKQYKSSIKDAFDENEAKWNYAYFLQNQELVIGKEDDEKELITDWIKEHHLYYTDQKLKENYSRAKQLGDQIVVLFKKALVNVVIKLHQSGIITDIFSRVVPVIIHDYDYDEETALLNEEANPKELIAEFVSWIKEL